MENRGKIIFLANGTRFCNPVAGAAIAGSAFLRAVSKMIDFHCPWRLRLCAARHAARMEFEWN